MKKRIPIEFVRRAERIRDEINMIFSDADHWNSSVRQPTEEKINPDPDGELKRALKYLNDFIEAAKP